MVRAELGPRRHTSGRSIIRLTFDTLNKDSFRRRMLTSGLLEATGARERDVLHRPAELYRFVRRSAL